MGKIGLAQVNPHMLLFVGYLEKHQVAAAELVFAHRTA